jgi:hypothetical protein
MKLCLKISTNLKLNPKKKTYNVWRRGLDQELRWENTLEFAILVHFPLKEDYPSY